MRHPAPTHHPLARLAFALLAVCFIIPSVGCDEVGAAYIIAKGPPKVPPAFELDPEKTTTVLVEDRSESGISGAAIGAFRSEVDNLLVDEVGVLDVVSGVSVARAARARPDMSLVGLGKAVGADTIVHVSLTSIAVSPDGQSIKPNADMAIRVIDIESGERVWPEGQGAVRLSPWQIARPGLAPTGPALTAAEVDTARWAALVVAQLFYEHKLADAANSGRGP